MKKRLRVLAGGLCVLLLGCNDSYGEQLDERNRTMLLRKVRDFQPASETRQECLGRLAFDVSGDLEWLLPGILHEDFHGENVRFDWGYHFPDGVPGTRGEGLVVDGLSFMISKEVRHDTLAYEHRRFHSLDDQVEQAQGDVDDLEADLVEAKAKNLDEILIRGRELRLEEARKDLAARQNRRIIDLDVPDSLAYGGLDGFHAFFYRGGRLIWIRPQGGDWDSSAARVREVMLRYRPRELYEIPIEPGICLPYGFIADDGGSEYHTKRSFRYRDRPGVVYTVNTGHLSEIGKDNRPQPAMFEAIARSGAGGPIAEGRTRQVVKPGKTAMGAYETLLGGVVLDTAREGEPEVLSYSAYAGYDGYMDVQALPFVGVEMQSFTRAQVRVVTQEEVDRGSGPYVIPGLQEEPPPFDESLERMKRLLANIGLRPTDPPMPELQNLAD